MPGAIADSNETLRVAIIGAGPAGLGAAIALSKLPNVQVSMFDQARELREVGAGIRIGYNCWRVLGLLEAAEGVRGHRKLNVVQLNGLTGEILGSRGEMRYPPRQQPHRVRRTRLQSALVAQVAPGTIQLRKRLVSLDNLGGGGVHIAFEDGTELEADLVLGCDGIKSVVRQRVFPSHQISFTGTTIFRTLIPLSLVSRPELVTTTTTWWYGPAGHIYTSPVDDPEELDDDHRMLEISCRNLIDPATDKERRFYWGIPATNERVLSHFKQFEPEIQSVLEKVPEGNWKEFAAFSGPRLDTITGWDKVALLGDASHPLSGAFGSGAAFALEDGWILAKAIEHTGCTRRSLSEALHIFDSIRSPYYRKMYEVLDAGSLKRREVKLANPGKEFEAVLKLNADGLVGEESLPWLYLNDIEAVWEHYLEQNRTKDIPGATLKVTPAVREIEVLSG